MHTELLLPRSESTRSQIMDHQILHPFLVLLLLLKSNFSFGYQYKVGDLDAWGVPPPSNSHIYSFWSQRNHFRIGDSLLFLYPPSQDSVIQVTKQAFKTCSISDPILKMNDGNTVFNITKPGWFYFTSGVPGHCQKNQKLEIAVPSANGTFFPSADAPAAAGPASSPESSSYRNVFGPSAAVEGASGSSASVGRSVNLAAWLVAIGAGLFSINFV